MFLALQESYHLNGLSLEQFSQNTNFLFTIFYLQRFAISFWHQKKNVSYIFKESDYFLNNIDIFLNFSLQNIILKIQSKLYKYKNKHQNIRKFACTPNYAMTTFCALLFVRSFVFQHQNICPTLCLASTAEKARGRDCLGVCVAALNLYLIVSILRYFFLSL